MATIIKTIQETQLYDVDMIDFGEEWNVGNAPEFKIHTIHAYPAKFPAFIAEKAINYARHEGLEIKRISDIFCGCGTVAFESKRQGIDFWGCDINPVATLIAKVKRGVRTNRIKNGSRISQSFRSEPEKYTCLLSLTAWMECLSAGRSELRRMPSW